MSAAVSEQLPYDRARASIADLGRHRLAEPGDRFVSGTAWAGVCALILVAPFEGASPLVRMPGQSISSVESALLAIFGLWSLSMILSRSRPLWTDRAPSAPATWRLLPAGDSLTLPWIALLAAMLVCAWFAPGNRMNAVHMVGRMGLAFGVYLLTLNAVSSPARVRAIFIAAAVVGVATSLLIILEYLGVEPVVGALRFFRPGTTLVGAQVRATGPFQSPAIASMYLEILFAFVAGLLLVMLDAAARIAALAAGVVLVMIGEAVTLTLTRSGLITLAASLAIVGALRYRRRGLELGVKTLALLAAVIAVQFFTSRSFDMLRLRLTTEGAAWYTARFSVPAELSVATGATIDVPVTVTNTGATAWDPGAAQPFRLSYHWLLADEDLAVNWEGLRTVFPSTVVPGATVSMQARVKAPGRAGRYRLLWDIEELKRRWFSSEPGGALFVTRAVVTGPDTGVNLNPQLVALPRKADRPGRFVLWSAGARMLAEHPFLGVGPDNFRLQYGPYAGLMNADPRVHSNNMYLEFLVGGGALVGAAFAWFVWRAAHSLLALAHSGASSQLFTISSAVLGAVMAVALHGFVDSFLGFTATYVLIAITLGLASACETLGKLHANRV